MKIKTLLCIYPLPSYSFFSFSLFLFYLLQEPSILEAFNSSLHTQLSILLCPPPAPSRCSLEMPLLKPTMKTAAKPSASISVLTPFPCSLGCRAYICPPCHFLVLFLLFHFLLYFGHSYTFLLYILKS